ncbi:hypothetical protein Rhow_000447 [Rhodococcus wratislaviensis]|uniref:Uncharacterized protein n=1 Tax=Rhodococcus wratislaviensis TaxID=44752 RepID=A0A402CMM7_RHOWR|nr:hypothetical protein Rhow_000447 [Rhodococcus wratislaviensis]
MSDGEEAMCDTVEEFLLIRCEQSGDLGFANSPQSLLER